MNERDKPPSRNGQADDQGGPGRQTQESRQSAQHSGAGRQQDGGKTPSTTGIGSSQGQDKGAREQGKDEGAGTADIERASARPQDSGSQDSMVNDPTGAFKERP